VPRRGDITAGELELREQRPQCIGLCGKITTGGCALLHHRGVAAVNFLYRSEY
jgi:hypothetical protein